MQAAMEAERCMEPVGQEALKETDDCADINSPVLSQNGRQPVGGEPPNGDDRYIGGGEPTLRMVLQAGSSGWHGSNTLGT
mmetsp:Transcript_68633/g.198788  ORF Transcript_68633/g.198788 Transcript_68633/m.198788 type:complete len:80 (+) Transcript_68633:734-973(+)